MTGEKVFACTKCGIEYPRTKEFWYARKRSADGLDRTCKTCNNKYRKGIRVEKSISAVSRADSKAIVATDKCANCGDSLGSYNKDTLCRKCSKTFRGKMMSCFDCKFLQECKRRLWTFQELVCERPDNANLVSRENSSVEYSRVDIVY